MSNTYFNIKGLDKAKLTEILYAAGFRHLSGTKNDALEVLKAPGWTGVELRKDGQFLWRSIEPEIDLIEVKDFIDFLGLRQKSISVKIKDKLTALVFKDRVEVSYETTKNPFVFTLDDLAALEKLTEKPESYKITLKDSTHRDNLIRALYAMGFSCNDLLLERGLENFKNFNSLAIVPKIKQFYSNYSCFQKDIKALEEIFEDEMTETILSTKHKATISGDIITVGCQSFPKNVLKEIQAALKTLNN